VIELKDLRTDHLNTLYTVLGKAEAGGKHSYATAKVDLAVLIKNKSLTRTSLAEMAGILIKKAYAAVKGEHISIEAAKAISTAPGHAMEKDFTIEENTRTLSPKTVVEHHRLISTVLDQAEVE